jgi:hypothetical protein
MMANYNYDRRAWVRVSVHTCDPEERAKIGKECASEAGIQKFLDENLFLLYTQ